MRVWYIPTLDCSSQFASYYKAVRKEESRERGVVLSAEASVDGSSRTGWKGRQARRSAVVRERGGCRSHAAEEEGRRLRSVGGVAVVVAGRGRVVDGGGGGCVGGGRGVVVNTHERSRQESSSSNGAPSSEAFRSLVEGG